VAGRAHERGVLLVRYGRRRELERADVDLVPRDLVARGGAARRAHLVPHDHRAGGHVEQLDPVDRNARRRGEAEADVVVDGGGQHRVA
jgi:hypothetical protein